MNIVTDRSQCQAFVRPSREDSLNGRTAVPMANLMISLQRPPFTGNGTQVPFTDLAARTKVSQTMCSGRVVVVEITHPERVRVPPLNTVCVSLETQLVVPSKVKRLSIKLGAGNVGVLSDVSANRPSQRRKKNGPICDSVAGKLGEDSRPCR